MGIKIIDNNKKAYFDYFIEDTYEAGIALVGCEVKSIRLGQVNIKDTFCSVRGDEVFVMNMHIKPYEKGSYFNVDAKRPRKLLLHRREIDKLRGAVAQKSYTIVPTKIYFKDGLVKMEIGLAKGKELHDKRKSIAEKEVKREIQRTIKQYNA
ncbi:MAG: SsrA-binding protein SmpB [Clostridiales bacterium]|nr:SsrA-binding protein SmpB [Clostridiales bacterium]MBD5100481.1 SsrA-binding protein SmpB [Clostridiales bacterium]